MTKDVQDAILILARLVDYLQRPRLEPSFQTYEGAKLLTHAIQHLAYPDRDVYPKTRKGTKGAPIVSRRSTVDDVR